MKSTLRCALVVAAVMGFAQRAGATPITYTMSGTASGQIGGTPFTNALVTYTGQGDTANIQALSAGGSTVFANPFSMLTVNISGVGTATITDLSDILDIPFALPPNPEIPSIPIVIFGRLDPPFTDLTQITGMGAVDSAALAGYDLTAIGPITSTGTVGFIQGCDTLGHDPCLHTTLGDLSFTSNGVFSENHTFTATLQPVPEPATLLLVSGGVAALARRSRRRQRD